MTETTEDVWTAFRQRLYGYIRARSRSDQDAEDILQDVFEKVHRRIGTLEDTTSLTAWMYRVTHNTIVDHYRKKQSGPLASDVPAIDEPDLVTAEETLAPFLHDLIDSLPGPYRDALTLTELEGMTQQEMGDRLGLSVSGAKSRVQRGRALVRDRLLDCCHIELDRRRRVVDFQPAHAEHWPEDCSCAGQ